MSSISSISASINPYQGAAVKSPTGSVAGANAPVRSDGKNDGDKDDGVKSVAAPTPSPAPVAANQTASLGSVNKLA